MSLSPFPLPLLFTSWTFHSDGGSALGNIMHRVGLLRAKSVAVDLDVVELTRDHVAHLQSQGLFVVAWQDADASAAQKLANLKPNGWMPQIEGDGQRDALLLELSNGTGAALPKAVVTTYGGLDSVAKVGAVRAAGIDKFFIECYGGIGYPYSDINRMLGQGQVYGIPADHLFATVSTYMNETPATYTGLKERTPNIAYYLGEPMTDVQCDAFGSLTPSDPILSSIPDPNILSHQIVALCDSWLNCFTDSKTKSRLRNIRRIAATAGNDTNWLAAQPAVTEALRAAGA